MHTCLRKLNTPFPDLLPLYYIRMYAYMLTDTKNFPVQQVQKMKYFYLNHIVIKKYCY